VSVTFVTAAAEGRHREGTVSNLPAARLAAAKQAYAARRLDVAAAVSLVTGIAPRAGDLVLARVTRLGQHPALQLTGGRRASLFVGDEIVVAYGNRYAPDQFEALVPGDLGPCQLAAAGGIAATVRAAHARMRRATDIEPVGLLADAAGRVLNLAQFRLREDPVITCIGPRVIAVAGTAMNAGKTTAAAHLIRGLTNAGLRVAAAKVTGTGAAGDVHMFADAGASPVVDFTDFGHASTYRLAAAEVEQVLRQSVSHLSRTAPDVVVLEIADGLFQQETAGLLKSPLFRRLVHGIVFAAPDAMSAAAGAEWLEHRGLPVLALSGALTASQLAMREAMDATQLPVLGLADLGNPDTALGLLGEASQRVGGIAT
jgi:hypothetical protein